MVTKNFMTPSAASFDTTDPTIRNGETLTLPVDRGFQSLPPLVSMAVMIERSSDLRRWFPQGLPTEEERLKTKCDVEFVL